MESRWDLDLAGLALALGARKVAGWSPAEEVLARVARAPSCALATRTRALIRADQDPLGDLFCELRSAVERRPAGATYTPAPIVRSMLDWAKLNSSPVRVVDPGVGSARFLAGAGERFPRAQLIGVDVDPVAAMLARATLAARGLAARSTVIVGDYRSATLPDVAGQTLFVGNPPYVRHHLIEPGWKAWLSTTALKYKLAASQLAGLHVHFFLATLERAKPGDCCVFITAAEWLDVNYGEVVRRLFLEHLGGKSIHLVEPTAAPFPDAATTAVISCCEVSARPRTIRVRRVSSTKDLCLANGKRVRRERFAETRRWTPLFGPGRQSPSGYVELGELCRVHRGQVTGANRVWIEAEHSAGLPDRVLFRSVTKARELIAAGPQLEDASSLRRVIDLPVDLDELPSEERKAVERFLRVARSMGANRGFVAEHRRAWWSVGLRDPAPILSTYMARRPPAFVRNLAEARHINIAHGLYPRDRMRSAVLDGLAAYLSKATTVADGRTYAGGLTKFEPSEVERLLVPLPDVLEQELATA